MSEPNFEYDGYTPPTGGQTFSSSMFGFNKDEVLDYLEETAEENFRRQEEAERRQREAEMRLQEAEMRLQDAERHIQEQNQHIRQLESRPPTYVSDAKADAEGEERLRAIMQDLEISHAATLQSEEELQESRELLYTAQQENTWLREEYAKYEQAYAQVCQQLEQVTQGQWADRSSEVADLQRRLQQANGQIQTLSQQLQQATQGQWEGPSPEEVAELQGQLQQANEQIQSLTQQLQQAQQAANEKSARFTDETSLSAQQAASAIIAEANHEADRIRDDATAEKERLHRQIRTSAGGLAESIYNLRTELADVEGDVSGILESVQLTLTDVMAALARTEQNLSTFGNQVDRFPHPSPSVKSMRPAMQYVPDIPEEIEAPPPANPMPASRRPAAKESGSGLQRVKTTKTSRKKSGGSPAFKPTYSTSPTAAGGGWPQTEDAYRGAEPEEDARDERVREVSDSLVDTLRQMIE